MIFKILCLILLTNNLFSSIQINKNPMIIAKEKFDNGDFEEAYEIFKSEADNNNPMAQGILGLFYEEGIVVETNYVTAFKYYKMSADKGVLKSKLKLKKLCSEIPEACKKQE